jgi:predicted phosphohydrolase
VSIAWISDCHLDRAAPETVDRFLATLRSASPEAVILTGDLSNASRLTSDLQTLAGAAGATIYHILGNHDYYGSGIGNVRDDVIALAEHDPRIQWLPPAGPQRLTPETLLIGVDGWADGRHGDPLRTPLVLNDDRLIAEVAAQETRAGKLHVKRILADADAARLTTLLERSASETPRRIIVATHVPPFVEALAPGSRESHPDWHPLLVSKATGDVLRQFASAHPALDLLVLAGHSHQACDVSILPNLRVRVAGARYGRPSVALVDAEPPRPVLSEVEGSGSGI